MRKNDGTMLDALLSERPKGDVRVYQHALDIAALAFSRMEELGMTQSDLAKKMGKSKGRISQIMSARYNMTLETISALEDALEIDLITTPGPRWTEADEANQLRTTQTAESVWHPTLQVLDGGASNSRQKLIPTTERTWYSLDAKEG